MNTNKFKILNFYSHLLHIVPIINYLKIMIGVILIISATSTSTQGCPSCICCCFCMKCFCMKCCCEDPVTPSHRRVREPDKSFCSYLCSDDFIHCGYLPAYMYREGFSDDQLREHAVTCTGFYFTAEENRWGIRIPIDRVPCESCGELERRVRLGPAAGDLPVTNWIIQPHRDPNVTRMIPDSKILAVMPTSSSDQRFIEEYRRRRIVIMHPDHQEMNIYE